MRAHQAVVLKATGRINKNREMRHPLRAKMAACVLRVELPLTKQSFMHMKHEDTNNSIQDFPQFSVYC